MKKKRNLLLLSWLLGTSVASTAPAIKTEVLRGFSPTDSPISRDFTLDPDKAWQAKVEKAVTLRLFELAEPGVDDCMVIFRAKLKTESVSEPAYLEMWCRFPGRGEFFSRGLENTVTGSNDWASYETPFFLKKGQQPDLIKLNLVLKGSGKIWIKDVELLKAPLPKR
jgi:hypothetical protein